MTTQTMFDVTATQTLSERLANTPLDPARGREREFRMIFAITLSVLVALFAIARVFTLGRSTSEPRRSIIEEARSAALGALPYAYRH